jgi:hypothetical protein
MVTTPRAGELRDRVRDTTSIFLGACQTYRRYYRQMSRLETIDCD